MSNDLSYNTVDPRLGCRYLTKMTWIQTQLYHCGPTSRAQVFHQAGLGLDLVIFLWTHV